MDSESSSVEGSPLKLSDANFDKAVSDNPRLVVDCWAPWCGPCIVIAPVINELAKDYSGRVTFGKVNVDENPKVSQQFGIMSIPTLLFISKGQLIERLVGVVPRKTIEQHLQKLL
jgi:thioredoxin 1